MDFGSAATDALLVESSIIKALLCPVLIPKLLFTFHSLSGVLIVSILFMVACSMGVAADIVRLEGVLF